MFFTGQVLPPVCSRGRDLLPRHPEHIDAFAAYLQNYSKSRPVERLVWSMLGSGVLYDYVEAELWMIAARMGSAQTLAGLLQRAQRQARRRPLSFSMRPALLTFFVSCRNVGVYTNGMTIKRLRAQTPYIQSLIVPHFVSGDFKTGGIASELVKAALPGMVLAGQMVDRSITVEELGVQVAELEPEVRNVFHGLGLIEGPKQPRFDQVGDVLRIRYGIPYWKGWRDSFPPAIISTRCRSCLRPRTSSCLIARAGCPHKTPSTMRCSGRFRPIFRARGCLVR